MKINRCRIAPNLFRDRKSKVYFGRKKSGGRTIWQDFQTTDRKRADASLRAWLHQSASLDADASQFTLEDLLAAWLRTKAGRKGGTSYNARLRTEAFAATFEGGMRRKVADVRPRELVAWISDQAEKRNWMPATFNRYRETLRAIFRIAVSNRIITESPFDADQIPTRGKAEGAKKDEDFRRHIPTYEQFNMIVAHVRAQQGGRANGGGKQSADFLEFLGEAMVGQAEAEDVRWDKVKADHIQFTRRKTGARFDMPLWEFGAGEGCLSALVNRLRAQKKYDPTGNHIFSIKCPEAALRNACRRLKLPAFTPRNLRSMAIVRMLRDKKLSFAEVAELQGHKDGGWLISTTYSFAKSDDADTRRAATLARMRTATDSRAAA